MEAYNSLCFTKIRGNLLATQWPTNEKNNYMVMAELHVSGENWDN